MPELSATAYPCVEPLVRASGMSGHLALVYEVLEGRQAGQVFVDSPDDPGTALVCNANGFYFAFGRPDEALVRPLVEQFWQRSRAGTAIFGSTPAWDGLLDHLCAPLGAHPEDRLGFDLHGQPSPPLVPPGFHLKSITARIAESILDGSGTDHYGLDPWFIHIAGGAQAYAALGLGMVLMEGPRIASMCGVCGLGHGEAEMEVGTIPAYRGRGLAAIACAAFMAQCRAANLHPAYSISKQNTPSLAVAHKLGFIESEEIHGYLLFSK